SVQTKYDDLHGVGIRWESGYRTGETVTLLTDTEIRQALASSAIEIDPLSEENLQPASYDLRMGNRAIVTRQVDVEQIRDRLQNQAVPEIDVAEAGSLSLPAGSFALVVTRERVRLSGEFAGHLGLRSYFARKGLLLLAGLQVDPGFEGFLVLGMANLSPRSIYIAYEEAIATLEIHRLAQAVAVEYAGAYAGQQTQPAIPRPDADYLRTIETLSVSDLTQALLRLSDNVSTLSRDMRKFWIPVGLIILACVVGLVADRIF
ncbi:MAG TPA: dCTP deaminase, partial [Fimbriimonadaceae bacterium]|nr:dCTP deaminase [Fimbriimonadaceae bacterium]